MISGLNRKYLLSLLLISGSIAIAHGSIVQDLEKLYKLNLKKAIEITNGHKSLPYSLKALEYASTLKDDYKIAEASNEISHDYEHMGNLADALRYVILSSKKFETLDSINELGLVYNRIGCLYSIMQQKDLAIAYLKKAILCHRQNKKLRNLVEDLNNIGEVYRINGDYKLALNNFTDAYQILFSNKDSLNFEYVAGNIGLVYASLYKNDSAAFFFNQSSQILKRKNDYYPITIYLIETAKILLHLGKTEEAIAKAREALIISERERFREQLRDVNKLLADIYLEKKDYKKAYEALYNYHLNKDSLSNNKVVSDMAELRADFEVSKRETQIKGLESVNKLRYRVNLGLGSAFLLVTLLTVFLIRINNQRKNSNHLLSLQKDELEQKNEIINSSLTEKETLLKEIHHRVKNNLQIISSLLNLQSRNVKNKKALEAFSESQRRLHSIALVHQKLYQNENLSRINIKEYINDLVETIHQSFYSPSKNIVYELNIADINLDVDTAVPLGLIVNELVTNAYKYAFINSKEGIISINLHKNEKSSFILNIKDNGNGLPKSFDINELDSLGMKLVNILTRQLNGKLEIISVSGAEFNIEFEDIIEDKA